MGTNKLNTFRNYIIPRKFNYKIEEIEKFLKNLNGILFAKIILSDDEDIKEIHIITNHSTNPKKVIRDIESLLLAKYNIEVDYRKISIAQVKEDEINNGHMTDESKPLVRLKISDVKISNKGNHFEVVVDLESDGKIFSGRMSGVNWEKNHEYLVAKAALEGINSFLEGSVFFQIDEIREIELESNKKLAVVSIDLINSKRKENLVGSTMVDGDFNHAVVKAILKATNRRILTKGI